MLLRCNLGSVYLPKCQSLPTSTLIDLQILSWEVYSRYAIKIGPSPNSQNALRAHLLLKVLIALTALVFIGILLVINSHRAQAQWGGLYSKRVQI